MCTSGRINFFWGVFSAFMVYALTLISTAVFWRGVFLQGPTKTHHTRKQMTTRSQNIIYIYIYVQLYTGYGVLRVYVFQSTSHTINNKICIAYVFYYNRIIN